MSEIPLPGTCHPAYADLAETIRTEGMIVDAVKVPFLAGLVSAEPTEPQPNFATHTLTRQRGYQTLYPEYGAYIWDYWVDELGRGVASEKAEWVENPMAITLPEWNPTRVVD